MWMIIICFCRPFLDWVTHQKELNHRSVSQQIKSRSGNDHAEQLRTKAEEDWGNVAIHHFLKTKEIRLEYDLDSRLVEVVWLCSCWLWQTCITETFSSSPAFWFVLPSAWRDLTAATDLFLYRCRKKVWILGATIGTSPHELGYNPYNSDEM